jgi:hypothetical protein
MLDAFWHGIDTGFPFNNQFLWLPNPLPQLIGTERRESFCVMRGFVRSACKLARAGLLA